MGTRQWIALAVLGALLAAGSCSNGKGDELHILISGTLHGTDCYWGKSITPEVRFTVGISSPTQGSKVELQDQHGNPWKGFMTSDSGFFVTEPQPEGDPRKFIRVADLTDSSAFVEAELDCVSFRCCSRVLGDVSVERLP